MGHLLVAAVVVVLAFSVQDRLLCSAQRRARHPVGVDRMNKILNDAKRRNGHGTMHLHGYGIGPSSQDYPIAEWPPHTEIIRATEGGTLLLPCNNTNNRPVYKRQHLHFINNRVSNIAIPPTFAFNGEQFRSGKREPSKEMSYFCNCTNEVGSGKVVLYRKLALSGYDLMTGTFSIALPNFTYIHTGLYECLHSNGSHLVVTKRYWVSATLFRHEVFDPPMENLTVRYGDPVEMVCHVRFNFLPGALKTRFIWRKGNSLLMARSIPDVAENVEASNSVFHFGVDEQYRCDSKMEIERVTWRDAGLYECWFRINDRLDEWIAQEAYLHVI